MKLKTQLSTLFGMIILLAASCTAPVEAPKSIDIDKLRTDIQKMEDAFAAGEKVKDVDAVVVYYSQDAVSYNRDEEPSIGMAAIKEKMAKDFAKDTTGNSRVYKVVDLFADGNMVVECGSSTTLNPAGEVVKKGYYMSYFQKRDGKYVCVRDMSVNSTPLKPAM